MSQSRAGAGVSSDKAKKSHARASELHGSFRAARCADGAHAWGGRHTPSEAVDRTRADTCEVSGSDEAREAVLARRDGEEGSGQFVAIA